MRACGFFNDNRTFAQHAPTLVGTSKTPCSVSLRAAHGVLHTHKEPRANASFSDRREVAAARISERFTLSVSRSHFQKHARDDAATVCQPLHRS